MILLLILILLALKGLQSGFSYLTDRNSPSGSMLSSVEAHPGYIKMWLSASA